MPPEAKQIRSKAGRWQIIAHGMPENLTRRHLVFSAAFKHVRREAQTRPAPLPNSDINNAKQPLLYQ